MRFLILLALATPARAERPSAWLFRATPGYGYGWDRAERCAVRGSALIGGWQIGNFVTPSLMVGGALGMSMSGVSDGCFDDKMEGHVTMGMTFGPVINWYPTSSGFHVIASAGVATFDQDDAHGGVGVSGSLVAPGAAVLDVRGLDCGGEVPLVAPARCLQARARRGEREVVR